jgi:hypothetical protein
MGTAALRTDAERKRLATLKARGALRGIEIARSTDDRGRPVYIAVKWAMCKRFETLDTLAVWMTIIDGQSE